MGRGGGEVRKVVTYASDCYADLRSQRHRTHASAQRHHARLRAGLTPMGGEEQKGVWEEEGGEEEVCDAAVDCWESGCVGEGTGDG